MGTPRGVEAELGWALGTVMRSYLRVADEELGGTPGGARGFLVLATLGLRDSSTQLALAQQLGVDRTMMTYLLDDLEGAGLVERRPDPTDRRARRVTLTEAGHARLHELRCSLHRAEDRLLDPLAAPERATLRMLLQRLAMTMASAGPCQVVEQMEEVAGVRRARRSR